MTISISAVPTSLRFSAGELHHFDLDAAKATLRMQLRRTLLAHVAVIAGLDLSYNEHSNHAWPPHWQAHWYLIVFDEIKCKAVKAALQPYFPDDTITPRPLRTRVVTESFEPLSYVWKSAFFRRVSYVDGQGRRNAAYYALKAPQERELLIYLSSHSATSRLLLHNLRREGGRILVK